MRDLEGIVRDKFATFNECLAELKTLASVPTTLNLGSIRNKSLKVSKSVQVKMNVNEFIRDEPQAIFLSHKPISLRNEILFNLPKKTEDIVKQTSTNADLLIQENNPEQDPVANAIEDLTHRITEIGENELTIQQLLATNEMRPRLYFERRFMVRQENVITLGLHHPVKLSHDQFSAVPPESPFKFWHVFGYSGNTGSLDFSEFSHPMPVDQNGVVVAVEALPKRLYFATNNHYSILQINDLCHRFNKVDCKVFHHFFIFSPKNFSQNFRVQNPPSRNRCRC